VADAVEDDVAVDAFITGGRRARLRHPSSSAGRGTHSAYGADSLDPEEPGLCQGKDPTPANTKGLARN